MLCVAVLAGVVQIPNKPGLLELDCQWDATTPAGTPKFTPSAPGKWQSASISGSNLNALALLLCQGLLPDRPSSCPGTGLLPDRPSSRQAFFLLRNIEIGNVRGIRQAEEHKLIIWGSQTCNTSASEAKRVQKGVVIAASLKPNAFWSYSLMPGCMMGD
jgi:hypothetical protein